MDNKDLDHLERYQLVNATKYTININYILDGVPKTTSLPPSEEPITLVKSDKGILSFGGVHVIKSHRLFIKEEMINIPVSKDGVLYLVESKHAKHLKSRNDIIAVYNENPFTGEKDKEIQFDLNKF